MSNSGFVVYMLVDEAIKTVTGAQATRRKIYKRSKSEIIPPHNHQKSVKGPTTTDERHSIYLATSESVQKVATEPPDRGMSNVP
jgi:hypothetical protein